MVGEILLYLLEEILLLPFEAGVGWLVERDDGRTRGQRFCLFLGVVFVLLAIAFAVRSGPWYGLTAGVVALALLFYGV